MALESYLPRTYSSRKLEKLFQQNRKQNWRAFLLACAPKRTYTLNKINLVVGKSLGILSRHLCIWPNYFQRPKSISDYKAEVLWKEKKTNEQKSFIYSPIKLPALLVSLPVLQPSFWSMGVGWALQWGKGVNAWICVCFFFVMTDLSARLHVTLISKIKNKNKRHILAARHPQLNSLASAFWIFITDQVL